MFELSQSFYFESAHSLIREFETESSRRIHGHTYTAEITVTGKRDPETGMVVDLAVIRKSVDRVRDMLDHRFLDDIPNLGPPTIENLCAFLWREFDADFDGLSCVRVGRAAGGDSCVLRKTELGGENEHTQV